MNDVDSEELYVFGALTDEGWMVGKYIFPPESDVAIEF